MNNDNAKKFSFPIISFFDAQASEYFNFDNGKIVVIPKEDCGQILPKNVEISFALPSEEIEVKCLTYKKDKYYFLNSLKGNVNENRVKAPCKHFGVCGGCLYQHMKKDFYKKFKINMLKKIFLDNDIFSEIEKISEIEIIGPNLRRKANFEGLKKNGEIFLGFHRFGSRQIINIESCEIMNKEISDLIVPLKGLLQDLLEEFQKCEFFIISTEVGLDIGFEIHGQKKISEEACARIFEFCKNFENIFCFSFRSGKNFQRIYKKSENDVSFLRFGKYKVFVNPYAFMQTSKEAEERMIRVIREFFPENHSELGLVDFFCGRGAYALNFESDFSYIYGFELDESALMDFAETIRSSNLIEKIKLFKHDLFSEEFLENFFNENQFVIINPPRAGAENVCNQISKSKIKPQNLVYVSCNPKTFASDAKILLESGFKISKIVPVDQFIWSNHLELIVHFYL